MGRDVSQRNDGPVPTANYCGINRPAFESQVLEPHCRTLSVFVVRLFCLPQKRNVLYVLFLGWICGVFESMSAVEYTLSNDMLISLRDVLLGAQRGSRLTYRSTHY